MADKPIRPLQQPGSLLVNEIELLRIEVARLRRDLDTHTAQARDHSEKLKLENDGLNHRARNTMALVRSVFERTLQNGTCLNDVGAHFLGRLEVLARYQLPRSADPYEPLDLEDLLRTEFHAFSFGYAAGISIEGPEVSLSPDHAQAIALAIHELVTNALKFGALSVPEAQLTLKWHVKGSRLELDWTETGVAIVARAPLRRGFGWEFIEAGLPYQIDAVTTMALRPGGMTCTISLPHPPPKIATPPTEGM